MRLGWLVWLLPACSFPRASGDFTCTVTSDCEGGRICDQGFCVIGEPDAPVLPPDAPLFTCTDWAPAPRHFDPCDIPLPKNAPLALDMPGVYTYDTTTGMLADPASVVSTPNNTMIATGRLISVSELSIANGVTLRVVGNAPLIIASWTTIAIDGAIDAGSTVMAAGAGSNPTTECAAHAPTRGGNSNNGAGGSGGGGFKGPGGNGGTGDGGGGGNNGGAVALPPLLAGCSGAEGGTGATAGGTPGAGGGAIQLTARMSVAIAGSVNAGGGGGGGSLGGGNSNGGGGGGGGSGGMIGIEAPTLTINAGAFLTANGGGGGQGGGSADGGPGVDGTAATGRPAGGLLAGGDGGPGGQGSGGVTLNGQAGTADAGDGGGGGGGGAGYIAILSANATIGLATISPVQVTPP